MIYRFYIIFALISAQVYAIQPDLTLLETQVYAVHSMHSLPADGALRARMRPNADTPALAPHLRYTLHWSLGEQVRPVGDWLSWESCPYAALTPLGSFRGQLLNLNCYDTFILGDYTFNEDTILVLPDDTPLPWPEQAQLYFYDARQTTLREAVEECLEELGAWRFEMQATESEDELRPAWWNGQDVNTRHFFEPLLNANPCASMGLRFDPHDGEHYRLALIEGHLMRTAASLLNPDSPDFPCDPDELREDFRVWRNSLQGCHWNNSAISALIELEETVEQWARLAQVQLDLHAHGISVKALPLQDIEHMIRAAAISQAALDKAVDEALERQAA